MARTRSDPHSKMHDVRHVETEAYILTVEGRTSLCMLAVSCAAAMKIIKLHAGSSTHAHGRPALLLIVLRCVAGATGAETTCCLLAPPHTSVMQGVGARRNQPLLHAVARVDRLGLASIV
jgi:hypothetical protein